MAIRGTGCLATVRSAELRRRSRRHKALARISIGDLVVSRYCNPSRARIQTCRCDVGAACRDPHLHDVLLTAHRLQAFNYLSPDSTSAARLVYANFIEEYHLLITIDSVENVSDNITHRLRTF